MPELPEVETTKRGIAPHVVNKTITRVEVRNKNLRWPVTAAFSKNIAGHKVQDVSRRAKYLLFKLQSGYFMLHLGMSGSLRLANSSEPLLKHDQKLCTHELKIFYQIHLL